MVPNDFRLVVFYTLVGFNVLAETCKITTRQKVKIYLETVEKVQAWHFRYLYL